VAAQTRDIAWPEHGARDQRHGHAGKKDTG
jgi:hypothetical protein